MNDTKANKTLIAAIIGGLIVAVILVGGTIWMGQGARSDTETAVRSVSSFYLDELSERREQVVANNLKSTIDDIKIAVGLMTPEDLASKKHLEAYQANMKKLYNLEKFAFVDENGLIYTSTGTQDNISDYQFDYKSLTEPSVSILNLSSRSKKVVLAEPTGGIEFDGHTLGICLVEIDMDEMLKGVSLEAQSTDATFCNIYTKDGVALSDTVLGGLAVEDNLLSALQNAVYEEGSSYEKVSSDFAEGRRGEVSFTYNGIQETLSYVPVEGTDWLLTYLIRESVISEQFSSVSEGIIARSAVQSLLTILALLGVFAFIYMQNRQAASLRLEKETADAENRVKHEELKQRLALQEQLLQQQEMQERQENMITALAADYWSVYYIELDTDDGICYQQHADIDDGFTVGERFKYLESVTAYAEHYVTDQYREEFLRFIQPDAIRKGLEKERVISYRYTVFRHGKESYEMVRFAGVRQPGERGEDSIHNVGACFTNVDVETRRSLAQNEALSQALATAEEASKAKTTFLSSMSHEIRTPMNAIIGLDHIALNDPSTPAKTKEYLEQIGDSAQHLLSLINDILDMSRIESGRMTLKNQEFSFPKMLEAVNTIFSGQCAEKGLSYNCTIDGYVDDFYIGDQMKLRQVLINILGNAVKFTPEGGSVKLGVKRTAQFDGKSTLQFTISDTGIGISKEYLPHIFDTFSQEDSSTTNKYGSSGLGMAITKSIVEMMNGHIAVESEKGVGTTFTVTVTLADDANPSDSLISAELRPQDMSVLVVDDDEIAREHAMLVLEKAGIAAEVASSGQEAISMVELHHARRDPYNLILIDWKMPEMDGVEATRRIRSIIGDESAIIILTAYRWDDVLEEALQAGVDSFAAKPLFAASVLEEFSEAVKRKGIVGIADSSKADLTGKRMLLAEDMQVNAEIVTMVLQTRDIEVELAENGKVALDKFAESPEGYYDAILMDMRMPEMDGLEATGRIRALEREDAKTVPIVALTANAYDEDVQRSLQAGLNAHLSKPVHPDLLFETLENLVK